MKTIDIIREHVPIVHPNAFTIAEFVQQAKDDGRVISIKSAGDLLKKLADEGKLERGWKSPGSGGRERAYWTKETE